MSERTRRATILLFLLVAHGSAARAQETEPPPAPSAGSDFFDQLDASQLLYDCDQERCRLTGLVELIPPGTDTKFFADIIDMYREGSRLVAIGNVVFSNPEGRISAERVEWDYAANTGTFYGASGLMSLGDTVDRAQFGNQDPDVYFWGDTIEKLGDRKYRITRGGFTTCVQPTPRWQITSGTLDLNLNDYAVARGTLLHVKGVPIMYMPWIYYPLQEDERATGFLLPTYGTSTLRGQAISNAFFWAIGRSHDATLFHDWFTRAGQGAGAEYRYVTGPQSSGNLRMYRFHQQESTFSNNGSVGLLPENTSFEISGIATQSFGRRARARMRLDYFSDIASQQLYHQNVYQASRTSRVLEGSLSGSLGPVTTGVLYQRSESFNSATNTVVYGSTPRVTGNVAPTRLFNTPVYGSVSSEYAFLPYRFVSNGRVTRDDSLYRADLSPALRVPLSRLTFLSFNTSAAYNTTYYSRSQDSSGRTVDEPYVRRYSTVRSEIVGPVFTRIWDFPESMFAERLKHVIEPTFTVDFTSSIANYTRAPVLSDLSQFVVGNSTRVTYGLTNRVFNRRRSTGTTRGQAREFLTIGLQQTYYSNPEASRYDTEYDSLYGSDRLVDLSPVALNVRFAPTGDLDADAQIEYDVSGGGLQGLSAGAGVSLEGGHSANLTYSHRRSGDDDPDDYLSISARTRWLEGRTTASYSLSWDLARGYVVSQRVMAGYLAQCCGIEVEFQKFNFPRSLSFPISADRRLNFSFVLAGLGTFSNFFGAFGGN